MTEELEIVGIPVCEFTSWNAEIKLRYNAADGNVYETFATITWDPFDSYEIIWEPDTPSEMVAYLENLDQDYLYYLGSECIAKRESMKRKIVENVDVILSSVQK